MSKKMNPDVLALKRCVMALEQCTSPRIVRATIEFLWDRYVTHPPAGYLETWLERKKNT